MRREPVEAIYFQALGTSCAVFTIGRARRRLDAAEAWVSWMGARLTRFDADSELSLLNSRPGRWQSIGADLESLLRSSIQAFERSSGLVNVAVERTMVALGYHCRWSDCPPAVTDYAGGALLPLPDALELRRGSARIEKGIGIDLGGIAKGWMADRLAERLGPNVLVNLGGDLSARGPGPSGGGWPVLVAGTTLLLDNAAAATSSVRSRRWGNAHHLVDPRTGLPSDSGLEEVSVVARDGVAAEVIAKAALLLGAAEAPAYCKAAGAMAWGLTS